MNEDERAAIEKLGVSACPSGRLRFINRFNEKRLQSEWITHPCIDGGAVWVDVSMVNE
jgi:hypothetical protein